MCKVQNSSKLWVDKEKWWIIYSRNNSHCQYHSIILYCLICFYFWSKCNITWHSIIKGTQVSTKSWVQWSLHVWHYWWNGDWLTRLIHTGRCTALWTIDCSRLKNFKGYTRSVLKIMDSPCLFFSWCKSCEFWPIKYCRFRCLPIKGQAMLYVGDISYALFFWFLTLNKRFPSRVLSK